MRRSIFLFPLAVILLCKFQLNELNAQEDRINIDSIINKCYSEFRMGEIDSSLFYAKKALVYMESAGMQLDSNYFNLLCQMTLCYMAEGSYPYAITLGEESLKYMEENRDFVSGNTVISMCGYLINAYAHTGDYIGLDKVALKKLSILERDGMLCTYSYINSLSSLLRCRETSKIATNIDSIIYRFLDCIDDDYHINLENVGSISIIAGWLRKSDFLYASNIDNKIVKWAELYLPICDMRSIPNQFVNYIPDVILPNLLSPVVESYMRLGRHEECLRYTRDIYKKTREYCRCATFVEEINTSVIMYNYCFNVFFNEGCFGEAFDCLQEAYYGLKCLINTMSQTHEKIYWHEKFRVYNHFFSNAAMLFYATGNYSDALWADTTRIFSTRYSGGNSELTASLGDNYQSISHDYFNLGDTLMSIKYLREAIECYSVSPGTATPNYATAIASLADLLFVYGDTVSAAGYLDTLQGIIAGFDLNIDNSFDQTLLNMVSLYSRKNQYTYAKKILDIILSRETLANIDKEILLMEKFKLLIHMNRASDALILEDSLYNQIKKKMIWNFVNRQGSYCTLLWSNKRGLFSELIPSAAYLFDNDSSVIVAANASLFAKSLLLNTEKKMREIILNDGDNDLINIHDSINLFLSLLDENQEDKMGYIALLKLEQKLSNRVKEYGDITRDMSIEWTDVQKALKTNEAAVEFNSFTTDNDTTIYVAYVIRPQWEAPKQVVLAKLIKGDSLSTCNPYSNTRLSRNIWKKLSASLDDAKTIYFAPSGELYNIAIESLPDYEDSTLLISDRYNLYRLSSTRELAKDKKPTKIKNGSIYGGLRYDATIDTTLRGSDGQRSFSYFPWTSDSISVSRGNGAAFLPGTLAEAKSIYDFMKRASIKTKMFTDSLGTEFSFKQMSGSDVNIIQIGTHGFYYEGTQEVKSERESVVGENKSMTRSGLLLAGANMTLKHGLPNSSTYNDGILTASEIAQLDLKNVDMVVLSACESGLGELKGDGVFGLQRGFKKAGVNTIVMSLWKVDDYATQLLMTQFYENWLIKKMTKQKALKAAQEYVRNYEVDKTEWAIEQREQRNEQRGGSGTFRSKATTSKTHKAKGSGQMYKPYHDPKYWAAFILLDGLD